MTDYAASISGADCAGKYPGSKAGAGVWQRIIGQMPPHSVYVEPFFGSGQVFWRKRRATSTIVIDRRADLLARVGAEAGVIAICGDAVSLLPTLTLAVDALVYCDPPYLLSTRNGRSYFQHEMSDRQHAAMLRVLKRLHCRVMLSGYPSALYSSQLQGWRCVNYRTRTRGRTVTECLWCNFPEPVALHDWRYAGKDFRQRLAFKRLATRWLARLEAMPIRKRGYVLQAVQYHFFNPGPSASSGVAVLNAQSGVAGPGPSVTAGAAAGTRSHPPAPLARNGAARSKNYGHD